ncbi:MAG: hypothetical protein ACJA1O_003622 [Spirosomataceae bacterium]|jgi:hypothetical protein
MFSACQRPMMRATHEGVQPKEQALLTYKVLNQSNDVKDECIKTTIEYTMDENGFYKSPFEADLKVYYRYAVGEELNKKDKKIQVMILDNKTNACLWRGETINLPKNLNSDRIIAYTRLLMQRFEWEVDNYNLSVRN